MCGLMRRTSYPKLEIFCRQNNPQSLKSIFRVAHKWIRGEDGTQSLSFQIMKCVD